MSRKTFELNGLHHDDEAKRERERKKESRGGGSVVSMLAFCSEFESH